MKIRLTTIAGTPLFNEGKLGLRDGQWREFDMKELTPEQLDLIEAYTGSIVQFAPEDGMLEKFAAAQGLEAENGRLHYPGSAEDNADKPALGKRHQLAAKPTDPDPAPKKRTTMTTTTATTTEVVEPSKKK